MSSAAETVPPLVSPDDHLARETVSPADPELVLDAMRPRLAKPVARRGFYSDMPDKGLFLLFAIGGFVATFAVKFAGATGLPTALASLAVLGGYAYLSYRFEWFRLHPDRLGDNCYYMGFLFTLASLSAALVNIETHTGDARGALIESLIGSFGVALFSTIGGITLRVVFMQLRREVEDIEEIVRNELQDAARLLKDQLGDAVQNLEGFRVRTQQVMDEQFTSVIAEFAAASNTMAEHVANSGAAHAAASERLANGAERAASELAKAAETMAAHLQSAGVSHQNATERLTIGCERVVEQVGRLVERIDLIEVPSDLLTRQVAAAREQISALAGALKDAVGRDASRQEAAEQATASLDRLLQRLSGLSAFDALEHSAARLQAGMETTETALRNVGQGVASHADSLTALVAQAERDREAMASARTTLETDLTDSTATLHRLQETLAGLAEALVKQLGGS